MNYSSALKKETSHFPLHWTVGHSIWLFLQENLLKSLEWIQECSRNSFGGISFILRKKCSVHLAMTDIDLCLFNLCLIQSFLNTVNTSYKQIFLQLTKLEKHAARLRTSYQSGCQWKKAFSVWLFSIYHLLQKANKTNSRLFALLSCKINHLM